MIFSALLVLLSVGVFAEGSGELDVNMTLPSPIVEGSILNWTWNASDSVGNVTIALFMSASDTANSTEVLIANFTNVSVLNTFYTFPSIDAVVLEDSAKYTVDFIATINQSGTTADTDEVLGTAQTNVILGRTTPDQPTTTTTSGSMLEDAGVLTYTVNGSETTGCTIAFLSGGSPRFTGSNTYAMTHSGNSCTYTIDKAVLSDGTYDVYVQSSDGADGTASARIDLNLNLAASNSQDLSAEVQTSAAQNATGAKIKENIGIIAIILIVVVMMMNQKGGRRR